MGLGNEPGQLALFEPNGSDGSAPVSAPKLPPLEAVPEPPLHHVRTLSQNDEQEPQGMHRASL